MFLHDEARRITVAAGGRPGSGIRNRLRRSRSIALLAVAVQGGRRRGAEEGCDPRGCALENLREQQVAQLRIFQFVPGSGSRDGRMLTSSQRVRADRGLLAVVLTPVQEDFSRTHRLGHRTHDEIRMISLERPRQLPRQVRGGFARERPGKRRIEMDPLAAAGDRDALERHPAQDLSHEPRNLGALGQPDTGSRIEVQDQPIRVRRGAVRPKTPLWNVEFEARNLPEPHERRLRIDERVGLRARGVLDRHPGEPLGRAALEVFREERHARMLRIAHTVGPALSGYGSSREKRQDRGGDAAVVIDDLALGRTGCRIQHLVEIGQAQPVPLHLHSLLPTRHGPRLARGA